jgi:hypothetical protein
MSLAPVFATGPGVGPASGPRKTRDYLASWRLAPAARWPRPNGGGRGNAFSMDVVWLWLGEQALMQIGEGLAHDGKAVGIALNAYPSLGRR